MKKRLSAVLLFIFLPLIVWTEETRILPLEEFLLLTAANDPEFNVMLAEQAVIAWGPVLEMPAEDWTFGISSELELNFPDTEWDNLSGTLSVDRLFRSTGTTVSADYTASPNTSSVSFGVSQELARNAFGRTQSVRQLGAEVNYSLARFQLTEAYEDYLAEAAGVYFDWQLAYAELENARAAYAENETLLANVRRRAANSIASEADVDRSLLQLYSREETLISARATYREKTLIIRQYTGLAAEEDIVPQENYSFPADWWEELPESPDTLRSTTRSGEILDLLIASSEAEYRIEAENLLPSVQLYMDYVFSGSDYGFDDSRSALTLGIAAELDWPNRRSEAVTESSRLEYLKQQQTAEAVLNGYWRNLRLLHDQIELMDELLLSAEKRVGAAERVYRARNEDYRQGRASLTELISDQNTLQSARHTLLIRSISRNALRLEWFRLTDQFISEIPE